MKKYIIISLFLIGIITCLIFYITKEKTSREMKEEIKENLNNILKTNNGTSSNPYDYIDNNYFNNIINMGIDAVPILINIYENNEVSKNGLDAYIIALAIQKITNCNLSYSTAEEFFELWKNNNCELNKPISLTIKSETLTNKGAIFVLKNNTDKEYWYGPEYTIEQKENETWHEVNTITGEPLVWNTIAYSLNTNEEIELDIDWSFGYGELKSGTYRLVKTAFKKDDTSIDESKIVYLYIEFNIK